MKRVSIADLKPGMIAAEDVLSPDTQTVVPKSTVLTENIIVRLENYCIYYVEILAALYLIAAARIAAY